MRLLVFAAVAAMAAGSQLPEPQLSLESRPVGTGAELLTVFGTVREKAGSTSVPLMAVLRDTLGDNNPDSDRLRYVWVLNSTSPTLLQRGAASIPFFYFRPDLGKNADRTPTSVLDLGATSHPVWKSLAGSATQVMALNSNGAMLRASSQRYMSNVENYQRTQFSGGLAVFTQLEKDPESIKLLSESERVEIESRLTLAGQTLGGLVNSQRLPEAYIKQRTQTSETLGHNWELLRQRAEANGLYFEPMGMSQSSTHALLWVAKEDATAEGAEKRRFDSRFLGISNPYGDERIKNWSGYSVQRMFDPEGRIVEAPVPGGREVEMIPLALYALDYPKVPLLLADFRVYHSAKRREMLRYAVTDTVYGVLGVSRWSNWPYMVGSWAWNFVRTRHGDAGNRAARLRAYAGVRQWLSLDQSLDADLRVELQKRLEVMGINPLEQSVFSQSKIAAKQYNALLSYADSPKGLLKRLDRDRQSELTAYRHSLQARIGLKLAHVVTLGAFTHKEAADQKALAFELGRYRRAQRNEQFLETVARSTPQVEVVWNPERIEQAMNDLRSTGLLPKNPQVFQQVLRQIRDEATRARLEQVVEKAGTSAGE